MRLQDATTLHHLHLTPTTAAAAAATTSTSTTVCCPKTTTLHLPILPSKSSTTTTITKSPEITPLPPHPKHQHQKSHHDNDEHSNFQEKMLYLDSIGVDIFCLLTNPHYRPIILSSSLSDIKSTVDFLSSMNFTPADLRRLLSMCPDLLSLNASSLLPVFTFLLREARVSGSHLRRVINRRPRLLVSPVESQLRPTLYFLQSIGIEEVHKHTYLLSCSVEHKLIPRIEYMTKLGFSYKDSVSMFRRFPQLFNYSSEENIEPKLNYFLVEMGRDLKELKEFPHYFSFSLENRIKHRHRACLDKGVCLSLRVMLKTNDVEFRDRLDSFYSGSLPVRNSSLWRVNSDVVVVGDDIRLVTY